jgi:predicted nucleic acid-binding Zn ribbon protein
MKHIREAVGQFLKASGLGNRQDENYIFENWKKIAGEETARMAQPFKMEGKKLFLEAENSVIMNELVYKKKALKAKINNIFRKEMVRDIVVRIKQ